MPEQPNVCHAVSFLILSRPFALHSCKKNLDLQNDFVFCSIWCSTAINVVVTAVIYHQQIVLVIG